MYIHFVAGLAAAEGKPLGKYSLLALEMAKQTYPDATILLHTAPTSCENAPSFVEVRHFSKEQLAQQYHPDYPNRYVTDICDILRLQVLYEMGGLYLDTDAFCKKPWRLIEQTKPHQLAIGTVAVKRDYVAYNNGVMYVPTPQNPVIEAWQQLCTKRAKTLQNKHVIVDYFSNTVLQMLERRGADILHEPNPHNVNAFGCVPLAKPWHTPWQGKPDWFDDADIVHMFGTNEWKHSLSFFPNNTYSKMLELLGSGHLAVL